jgi:hypothetical protein
MRLPVTTPPGALPSQFSTALQIPALSLLPDFFPGVLEVSGPSGTLGDRLGVGASLGGWPSLAAFLVLRQLLEVVRKPHAGRWPVSQHPHRAGGSLLSSRLAWSTEQVSGEPGLHSETLSNQTPKSQHKQTASPQTSAGPLQIGQQESLLWRHSQGAEQREKQAEHTPNVRVICVTTHARRRSNVPITVLAICLIRLLVGFCRCLRVSKKA